MTNVLQFPEKKKEKDKKKITGSKEMSPLPLEYFAVRDLHMYIEQEYEYYKSHVQTHDNEFRAAHLAYNVLIDMIGSVRDYGIADVSKKLIFGSCISNLYDRVSELKK